MLEVFGKCFVGVDFVICDIFLILENDCGILFGYVDVLIDVIFVDDEIVDVLYVEESSFVLCIECFMYDVLGVLIDYEYFYFCGDVF